MLANKKLIQSIIDAIPNPIIVTDAIEMKLANKNFLEFFDFIDLEQFISQHKCICHLFQDEKDYFSLNSINKNILWTEYISKSRDNIKVLILYHDNSPHSFNIQVKKIDEIYFVILTDITAYEQNKYYHELAYHDHLTKIYNRQMFEKLYKKELSNYKRYKYDLSLIMLDIDHFKNVNDTYGHDVGDKILIILTNLIGKNLRDSDIFARWGGEEFMILLPHTNLETAYKKAQELKKFLDIEQKQIPHFTASFGVTQILHDDKDTSSFIRVDKALYQAKIKRNDVVAL